MRTSFFPIILCSLLAVASCGETESSTDTTAKNTAASSAASCYAEQYDQYISVIQIQQDKDTLQGYYTYEPYEKDRGYGTFTGKVSGDQINAKLTYIMEGGVNEESSLFKLADGNLIQAIGKTDDASKIEWANTYKRIDCSKVQKSIDNAIAATAEIKEMTTPCMDKALSTVDMQACHENAYRDWDEKLNRAYKALQDDVGSDEARAALKTSQQHWLKFRDAELAFINKMYQAQQGTYWGTVAGSMKVQLIKTRVQILEGYLDSLSPEQP